jgi:hypothetical protein
MPAHTKFTRRRERRVLALIDAGATIAEASRAVSVSRQTVYRRARSDAAFAHRLDLARIRLAGAPAPSDDWRASAAFLESAFPERWALPDAFSIDDAQGRQGV